MAIIRTYVQGGAVMTFNPSFQEIGITITETKNGRTQTASIELDIDEAKDLSKHLIALTGIDFYEIRNHINQ